MKIAIMQPYLFPYIGYFQLIKAVDRFILGDCVQYIKQGWINRNRILKPEAEGSCYIQIPIVKHHFNDLIKDIRVIEGNEWKEKILRQVQPYKKKSPYYKCVYELLTDCLASNEKNITTLNGYYLKKVCDYIGIDFKTEIQSEMNFDYSGVSHRGDRPIRMSEQLGASEYLNLIGGIELYDKALFKESNITLGFLQPNIDAYDQHRNSFEPGLSIIDVMMFNSPEEIRELLNNYQVL